MTADAGASVLPAIVDLDSWTVHHFEPIVMRKQIENSPPASRRLMPKPHRQLLLPASQQASVLHVAHIAPAKNLGRHLVPPVPEHDAQRLRAQVVTRL